MLDRTTFGRCADLGLPSGMAGYVQGRLGVMGDVSADEADEATDWPSTRPQTWPTAPTSTYSPLTSGPNWCRSLSRR
jgi:hypothetical protein